jgi:hypothetical protein
MLREIDQDTADGVLVLSKRFTEAGGVGYPPLLRSAASEHNEAWLAESLIGSFIAMELAAGKWKKVGSNAHTLFAQCEFNRFYCRAVVRTCWLILIMASAFIEQDNPESHDLNLKRSSAECSMSPSS